MVLAEFRIHLKQFLDFRGSKMSLSTFCSRYFETSLSIVTMLYRVTEVNKRSVSTSDCV